MTMQKNTWYYCKCSETKWRGLEKRTRTKDGLSYVSGNAPIPPETALTIGIFLRCSLQHRAPDSTLR